MPSPDLDFFDLNRPEDLFRLLQSTMTEYVRAPNEKDFLFLALGFTHLREWISESNRDGISRKRTCGIPLTEGEELFASLDRLPSFNTIRSLCNRGKHHITREGGSKTTKISQFRVGIGRAGDSLGQTYFMIDGVDSRNHFWELMEVYAECFQGDA